MKYSESGFVRSLSKIILCCLLLILIISLYNIHRDSILCEINNFINGYWQSDSIFSSLSGVDDMILMLNTDDMTGLLIIVIDKNINGNDEFNFQITNYNKKNNLYTFDIEFTANESNFIWYGKELNCILSINKGSLDIYDNETTMMAKLLKNNNLTNTLD
jgi:hypothetical protein